MVAISTFQHFRPILQNPKPQEMKNESSSPISSQEILSFTALSKVLILRYMHKLAMSPNQLQCLADPCKHLSSLLINLLSQ